MDPDPGSPKTCGSGSDGSGSATLLTRQKYKGKIYGKNIRKKFCNPKKDPEIQKRILSRIQRRNKQKSRIRIRKKSLRIHNTASHTDKKNGVFSSGNGLVLRTVPWATAPYRISYFSVLPGNKVPRVPVPGTGGLYGTILLF
jgi:hypothetical protein